jgi:GT2 family glycosyltransferase
MKIGVGVITCNRPEFCRVCLNSLPKSKIDELVIVNDGSPLPFDLSFGHEIENETNLGVGKSKNKAMQYLLDKGCDYIFIIEDDMKIIDGDIFKAYINASKETGIQHFMFAYHGPANKNGISGGLPSPRKVIEYPSGLKISLNQHCVGAFCMYTKEALQDVGLFDTEFNNAFEHVHHSYVLCKKGYCTEYWWWPDIANSMKYIQEQACSEQNSAIRPRKDWQENIKRGFDRFIKLENVSPVNIPDSPWQAVTNKLKQLKTKTNTTTLVVTDDLKSKVDVIILSLASTSDLFNKTKRCVESYLKQGGELINKVYVVESYKQFKGSYNSDKVEVIIPDEEFNYNRFYNIALSKCTAEYVMGPNNDVIVQPGCINKLVAILNNNPNIHSLSPVDRKNTIKQTYNNLPGDDNLYCGYHVALHILGCCFICRRNVFSKIGYLDEQFYFFYQDNDYAMCLERNHLIHGVYTGAHILHESGSTNNDAPVKFKYLPDNMNKQGEIFHNKWFQTEPFKSGGFKSFKKYP